MINIKIDKAYKVNGDYAAYVSFPYNDRLISVIRELPDRTWHKDEKEWEIPLNSLLSIMGEFSTQPIKIVGYIEDEKTITYELPAGFNFKTEPYKHQIKGLQYALENSCFLLGDEQGLGKTKQIIDTAIAKRLLYGYKHCLIIVCVNGLKWNWYEETKIHANETSHILGARINSKGKLKVKGNADKLADLVNIPDNYFLITNIESLRSPEISSRLKELCEDGTIGMVAVDEVHKCKNPNSQQSKGLMKLQAATKVAMTGTPVLEKPLDLFIILKWLGFEKHSFYQFKKHYCVMGGYGGHEVIGYKNIAELHNRTNEIMLRRRKKDVLDLPPKIRVTEYIEMGNAQQLIYDEVRMDILTNIDQVKSASNPLAQLIRLRQATGYTGILSSTIKESAKLDRMEELVEEAILDGRKIIIYSNWTSITDEISRRLDKSKICHVSITGQYNSEDNHIKEGIFQTDPDCKVCVGTIGALGTGFTLTAATYEIFVDEPWNMKLKEQAEDRAHRIGTTEPIQIVTLVTKDSIDERINQLVIKKGLTADAVVDGQIDMTTAQQLDFLLS